MGLLLCQGVRTFCHLNSAPRGAREPSPARRRAHPCSSPLPAWLAAPSRPYLPRMAAPAPPAASRGNQWGAPALIGGPATGRAPCHPYRLQTRGRGEPAPSLPHWGQGWGHCHGPALTAAGGCSRDPHSSHTAGFAGVQPRPSRWSVVCRGGACESGCWRRPCVTASRIRPPPSTSTQLSAVVSSLGRCLRGPDGASALGKAFLSFHKSD